MASTRPAAPTRSSSGSTRTSPTPGSPSPPTASGPGPISSRRTATPSTRLSAGCDPVPARSSSRSRSATGVEPVSIGKPAPYLLEAAAHAVGREPARGGDDRRRHRDRPCGGPGGRCALHPDADRRHDPGPAGRAARRRSARPRSPPTRPSWQQRWSDSPRADRRSAGAGASLELGDRRRPSRRTRARNGSRTTSSANATSSARRSIAHSSGTVSPIGLDRADVLLGQGDVGDGRVVGAERDRHAGPMEAGQRMRRDATARSRPASSRWDTGRGSLPRAISSTHRAGSSMAPGPWAIRSGSQGQRPTDLRRAAPLAGVERDPQAAGPRRLERPAWTSGSGKRASGPARSKPVRPVDRGIGRRSRPAGRSPRGRATAARCR